MEARIGTAARKTAEVDLEVEINLDEQGSGYELSLSAEKSESEFNLDMLIHFLAQVFRLGNFGGKMVGHGDLPHHLIEDAGICLGQAFAEALGDKAGITRSYSHLMPMEGSLVTVAVDLSGRADANCDFDDTDNRGLFEIVRHLLKAITQHGQFDLYCKVQTLGGVRSDHHKLETLGKALGIVLYGATRVRDPSAGIPSTKGAL